jgi:Cys-tRNA(Pro) deacylase
LPLTHEDLKAFLADRDVNFKIYLHEETYSAEKASKVLGKDLKKVVKTVVFVDEKRNPLLVIMPGHRKVNQNKLAKLLGKKKLRLAKPEEVLEATGYEAGAVPPVGHKNEILTILDEELLELDRVSAGGGSVNATLEISPRDIVTLQHAKIMRVP